MESRNISITIDKAIEWYNSNNKALKEVALQAFSKEELEGSNFKNIKTFDDAVRALDLSFITIDNAIKNILKCGSRTSVAMLKLNIIGKALNKGKKMEFAEGRIWHPYNPVLCSKNSYIKNNEEVEVAKVRINNKIYTLIGGNAFHGSDSGLGDFDLDYGMSGAYSYVGFLGCATKEIAQHMGRYFAKEIFEVKYSDYVDYEWV